MSTSRILSNFSIAFFPASGCWGDILLVGAFLTYIYAFISLRLVASSMLIPRTPFGALQYLHVSSDVQLIFDEGPVKLNKKKEQVGVATWSESCLCSLLYILIDMMLCLRVI